MNEEKIYIITCKKKHEVEVSTSELEELLSCGSCPECESEIEDVSPNDINITCVECTWGETTDWESAGLFLWQSCPRCSEYGFNGHLHIEGSFYHEVAKYDEYVEKIKTKDLIRENRPDYWEVVIHFCDRKELISILEEKNIKAANTGYYKYQGVSAVCFTDTPLIYSNEIRQKHGDYGIAFRKKDLIVYGGQPVIYLTDELIKHQESGGGFCPEIKPLITLLRIPSIAPSIKYHKKIDFLHEREWRVAKDVDFRLLKPLGLVFPKGHSTFKFAGDSSYDLINYAYRYGELSDE